MDCTLDPAALAGSGERALHLPQPLPERLAALGVYLAPQPVPVRRVLTEEVLPARQRADVPPAAVRLENPYHQPSYSSTAARDISLKALTRSSFMSDQSG